MAERAYARLYGPTLLGGLVGAAAVAVGTARPWAEVSGSVRGVPVVHASVDGASVAPLAAALGYVVLAGFGAVVATRGTVRRAVGVVVLLAAAAVVVVAVAVPSDVSAALHSALRSKGYPGGGVVTERTGAWRWVCLAGAVIAGLAGATVAVLGGHFAVMGARYDTPAPGLDQHDEPDDSKMWRAIDRGDDPTHS
jgi:uncharacterized membrane protein (TIGR02234 family)